MSITNWGQNWKFSPKKMFKDLEFLSLITKMPLIHLIHENNHLGTQLEIFTQNKENMFRDFEIFFF